jgi:V8-like Glu-specific endopeptidase
MLSLITSAFASSEFIVGKDTRILQEQISSPFWKLKGNAVAGVIMNHRQPVIFGSGKNAIWVNIETLGEYVKETETWDACPNMKFKNEPKPFHCSAFLVDPQHVMTAGHCVHNQKSNVKKDNKYLYVKNLPLKDEFELSIYFSRGERPKNLDHVRSEDLYKGQLLVEGVYTQTFDMAIVKLDRPVTDIRPLEVQKDFVAKVNIPTRIIGHPLGLPLMHEASGHIIYPNWTPYTFSSNNSIFQGNSGSPMLDNRNAKVIGILTSGRSINQRSYFQMNKSHCMDYYVIKKEEDQADGYTTKINTLNGYLKDKRSRESDAEYLRR